MGVKVRALQQYTINKMPDCPKGQQEALWLTRVWRSWVTPDRIFYANIVPKSSAPKMNFYITQTWNTGMRFPGPGSTARLVCGTCPLIRHSRVTRVSPQPSPEFGAPSAPECSIRVPTTPTSTTPTRTTSSSCKVAAGHFAPPASGSSPTLGCFGSIWTLVPTDAAATGLSLSLWWHQPGSTSRQKKSWLTRSQVLLKCKKCHLLLVGGARNIQKGKCRLQRLELILTFNCHRQTW